MSPVTGTGMDAEGPCQGFVCFMAEYTAAIGYLCVLILHSIPQQNNIAS
jgi:hypothetical protein